MVLLDAATKELVVQNIAPSSERKRNTDPFGVLVNDLGFFWSKRAHSGREHEPMGPEDMLALRNVVEPFLTTYTDGSPILPLIKERLNPYKPDTTPCHRLELDHIEGKANWRDGEADVAAIPYAPPLSFLLNPPERLYEAGVGNIILDIEHGDQDLARAVYGCIYERGIDHLWSIGELDESYRQALLNINAQQEGNSPDYTARLMVTWAIDSAIPGVDAQRVVKHEGSIEAICGDNPHELEIPSISRLNELSHEVKTELNRIYEGLAEMADNAGEHPFTTYDERCVALFMRTRSIVDTCRWYVEHNTGLSAAQREILQKTLVDAYTIYHAVLQTGGSKQVDDIRSLAFRDVSTLLCGSKVDTGVGSADIAHVNLTGEEDYLGAFMAAASYDGISRDYGNKMLNGLTRRIDWHGGARSYFGTFEHNPDSTIRQQLTLMCLLYYRMPQWQQETYKDLISSELSKKLSHAMGISSLKQEQITLYIPTQDLPIEVISDYQGGFDWNKISEIHAASQMMPLIDLLANHSNLKEEPRLQIKPGDKRVIGLSGELDESGAFVPDSKNEEVQEVTPAMFIELIKQLSDFALREHSYLDWGSLEQIDNFKEKLDVIEKFVRGRSSEVSNIMPFLEERLNPPPIDMLPCRIVELPEHFVRNGWEHRADHALVPHVPPIEYLLHPPENLWQGFLNIEKQAQSPINSQVEKVIIFELLKTYGDVPELTPLFNDPQRLLQIYYTWAEDTRIEGVEALYALVHQPNLQRIFEDQRTNDLSLGSSRGDAEELRIIMPHDLILEVNKCHRELLEILKEAQEHVNASPDNIYNPREADTSRLGDNIHNIILAARWHMDHLASRDTKELASELSTIANVLESAYLSKNLLLQECNQPGADRGTGIAFHDISSLIGGYKIDSVPSIVYGDRIMSRYENDYFDAFMAVANAREVAATHMEFFNSDDSNNQGQQRGARALFSNFESQAKSKKQQLVLLTTIYHRMPAWQRDAYKVMINSHFDALEREIAASEMRGVDEEPLLFIPSASSGRERNDMSSAVYGFGKPPFILGEEQVYSESEINRWRLQVVRAQYLDPVEKCLYFMSRPSISKLSHGVEVLHNGSQISGFGAGEHWVDELGFLHHGYERRRVTKQSVGESEVMAIVEQMGQQREGMWLAKLSETPSITVESRLGKEMARKIETLLDQDTNNGSMRSLGSLSVVLEQLLGRKLGEGDLQYLEMLKSLGMLNREVVDVENMNEGEIMHMLQFVKTEKPKMEDMDESSLILLFLGAAGVAPRQELVEQIIKAHETTTKVLTLEAVLAIESIAVKKKLSILQMLGLKPKEAETKSFLSRRDELRAYLAEKRRNDRGYEPEADEVWGEMQMGMLRYITDLLHSAKRYDSTADATLYSVLTAKDKGELLARCSTNAELLAMMINVGIPEFGAHLTSDYGPEGNLSLQDWLRHLLTAKDSGGESHAYTSHNSASIHPNSGVGLVLADGEAGSVRALSPNQVQWLHAKEMTYGTQANHDYGTEYVGRSRVIQYCVHGGSFVTASLAIDMRQFDLAEMANPDSIPLNRMVISAQMFGSHLYSTERRAKALRRVMSLSPYDLAMTYTHDYTRDEMIARMSSTIELGREVGNWGAAFLAANIMRNAGFLGSAANQQGAVFISQLARRVAMFADGQYSAILKQHSEFLTANDLEVIAHEREKYLAELAELKRKSGESGRKTEKSLKRSKMVTMKADFESSAKKTKEIYKMVHEEELQRKRKDREEYGQPEGEKNAKARKKAIDRAVDDVVKKTVDQDKGLFDDHRFELLTEGAQDALLIAAVTDQNGVLLAGSDLDDRIQAIHELLVRYSYNHTALRSGSMGTGLMHLGAGTNSALVGGFQQMANRLNERLERAIKRKGLPVSTGEFNARQIAERMGKAGTQKLLGRNKTPQLGGAVQ